MYSEFRNFHFHGIMVSPPPPDFLARIKRLEDALVGESSRGQILVLTAHIDYLLQNLIASFLKPPRNKKKDDELFRPMAPLDSFAARISMAFRLGLISAEDAAAFDILRSVRNDCAHAVVSFSPFAEPVLSRLRRFVELTRQDEERSSALERMCRSKKDDEYAYQACICHIGCLEGTLAACKQVGDSYWRAPDSQAAGDAGSGV
jgi:hypothetical protein